MPVEFVEFILKTQANKIFFVMQAPWTWGGGGSRFNDASLRGLFVVRTLRGLVCAKDWKQTLWEASCPVLSLADPSL